MQFMPDFLDSTGLEDNGPALAERLERDGYLFIRGLLPREAVLEVRARLLDKAAANGWLAAGEPVDAGIANPGAAAKDPEEAYMRAFRTLWADEALHRLRTHPDSDWPVRANLRRTHPGAPDVCSTKHFSRKAMTSTSLPGCTRTKFT